MTTTEPTQEDTGTVGISQNTGGRKISCDQVAWLLDIAERYLPQSIHPVSREREMKKYAMLYEIMEIAELTFADDAARWNGTPNDVRDDGPEDEQDRRDATRYRKIKELVLMGHPIQINHHPSEWDKIADEALEVE